MRPFLSLFLVAAIGIATCLTSAASGSAPGVVMDDLSRQTLVQWAALEYRPSDEPLARGSVDIAFKGTSRGRPIDGAATYSWEVSEGEASSDLDWEPPALGARLTSEGWSREILDQIFLPSDPLDEYEGCSLTAARSGDQVVITVSGEAKSGVRRMLFDSMGVLVKSEYAVRNAGFQSEFTLEFTHEKHDNQYVVSSKVFKMNRGGTIEMTSSYSFTTVEGVILPSKIVERSTWNGRPGDSKTITWMNWELEPKRVDPRP